MTHKLFLLLILLPAIARLNAQTAPAGPQPPAAQSARTTGPGTTDRGTTDPVATGPRIIFDSISYDFGSITYNSPGSHIYTFTNAGSGPLLVTNCVKGCGCTSVEWTKELVRPGEKGMVKVVYNTHKVGFFSRGVDVYSNDLTHFKINLRLKGTVQNEPPDQVNAAMPIPKENQEKW